MLCKYYIYVHVYSIYTIYNIKNLLKVHKKFIRNKKYTFIKSNIS